MRKCLSENINSVIAQINEVAKVYLPVDRTDGKARFEPWAEGKEWSKALNTEKSAKEFFFPQTEDLVEFKREGKNIEIIDIRTDKEDFVIFGVRGCDVKSFEILDRVFLVDPIDSFYKARREHGIVISVACGRPSETCFCSAFGIDAAAPGHRAPQPREPHQCATAHHHKGNSHPTATDCDDDTHCRSAALHRQ